MHSGCPSPALGQHLQGCERSTGEQPAARSRGRLDFERKTELIAISANRRALVRAAAGVGRDRGVPNLPPPAMGERS